MLNINGKNLMNIEEAVQWLLQNNALPFQCKANYAADTVISKTEIVNPSPAEIKVGALVYFADAKIATVTGITSNGFMVGSDYVELANQHLEGDVQVDGNLEVTGDLTADSIVENMEGYSYNAYTELPSLNVTYAGVVKTGNKITFVLSFDFTTADNQTAINNSTLGAFTVPADILDKLVPMQTPFTGYLDIKQLQCFYTDGAPVVGIEYAYKQVGSIEFNCKVAGLNVSTKYFCRIEKTFLLSDSLTE